MSEQVVKVNGVDVHVEGQGPYTIVMVHGFPDTYRLWDGTVAALKDQYRCARFTLPGFVGEVRREGYALEEIVGLIRAVAETVSPGRRIILMCHDWGCVFGYQFYARHPDMVARVVGIDIGDARSLRREIDRRGMLYVLSYQWFLALAWKIGGALGTRMTRWMRGRMRCPSDPEPVSWQMTWPYYMVWFGAGYRGHIMEFRPTCPMLYLYARKKPFMFHAQSWLDQLRANPGSRVQEFDTGHWIMLTDPERFNATVRDWLGRPG